MANAALLIARALGAIALLAVGAIQLEQYKVAHFPVVPTIGPLFLTIFLASAHRRVRRLRLGRRNVLRVAPRSTPSEA